MKLTIIPSDSMVYVDGVARIVDCSTLTFHALQWDGEAGQGEIEHRSLVCPTCKCSSRKPNEPITEIGGYQAYVDAWVAAAPPGTPDAA